MCRVAQFGLSIVLAGALALCPAHANPPATRPAESKTVDELIAQLSADRWQDRHEAQEQLARVGLEVRPMLEKLRAQTADEDLRTQLDSVLRQIDERRRFGPTEVTLRIAGGPARGVFMELGKRAGVAIEASPPGLWAQLPELSIEAKRESFWGVMARLCDKAGVEPVVDSKKQIIRLVHQKWASHPRCVAGPLLIIAQSVTRSSELDFANAVPDRSTMLELRILADPKLRILRYSQTLDINEATDEFGKSMVGEDQLPSVNINTAGNPLTWETTVDLSDPRQFSTRLALLKGKVRIVVPARTESVEVADLLTASGATRTVGGRKFVVGEVKSSGENWTVPLVLHRGFTQRDEWRMTLQPAALRQAVRVLDKNGRPMPLKSVSPVSAAESTRNEVNVTFTFGGGVTEADAGGRLLDPARLIFEAITEVRDLAIPFELSNIVLP